MGKKEKQVKQKEKNKGGKTEEKTEEQTGKRGRETKERQKRDGNTTEQNKGWPTIRSSRRGSSHGPLSH